MLLDHFKIIFPSFSIPLHLPPSAFHRAELSSKLSENDIFIADFDVTDKKLIKSKFELIKRHFQNIDVLINNAGRLYLSEFLEDDQDDIEKLFQINYFANLNVSREVIRFWKQTNQTGQIAVTSSTG